MCLCVCLCCLQVGKPCCFNVQICMPINCHSNTKCNTTYNLFALCSLKDILCKFAKVNHDLTTQLSIIITGLLTTHISKMAVQNRPVSLRMHWMVLTVKLSGFLKLYLNPWKLLLHIYKYEIKCSVRLRIVCHITFTMTNTL